MRFRYRQVSLYIASVYLVPVCPYTRPPKWNCCTDFYDIWEVSSAFVDVLHVCIKLCNSCWHPTCRSTYVFTHEYLSERKIFVTKVLERSAAHYCAPLLFGVVDIHINNLYYSVYSVCVVYPGDGNCNVCRSFWRVFSLGLSAKCDCTRWTPVA
jgi:hypothetical protein